MPSPAQLSANFDALAKRLRRFAMDPASLVGTSALVVLLGIWGAIGYEAHRARAGALEEWGTNLTNLTRAFGEHTLRTISAVDQDLRFVRNQYNRFGNSIDLPDLLRQGAIDGAKYKQIGVIDTDGFYRLSSRNFEWFSVADRPYFQVQRQNLADTVHISEPLKSRVSGKWIIQMTRRLADDDGGFNGVVLATLDPEYLGSLYGDINLGRGGIVSLIGEDGIVRARRQDGEFSTGDNLSHSPMIKHYHGQQVGTFTLHSTRDNIERLYTFRHLPGYPLIVVLGVPLERVYERANEQRDLHAIIGAAASLLIVAFTALTLCMLRRQGRTLRKLRESRAQAESANRLKSEFLASMSHELRTPLNGILGFSDIQRRKSTDEKSRRHGELIHSSGTHLLALLNSILDLAKVEAGKMDVYARPEDLLPLVENTAQIHKITAGAKGLHLETLLAGNLPARIYCDGTLLRQVLNNLISNAIKFTEQGSVTVRVERDMPGMLRFSVADTGIGIAPEAIGLVFEKFRQADQSITRSHHGTGLGLTLAKQFVELMGGQIGLSSVPGMGTTIWFTLPIGAKATLPATVAKAVEQVVGRAVPEKAAAGAAPVSVLARSAVPATSAPPSAPEPRLVELTRQARDTGREHTTTDA